VAVLCAAASTDMHLNTIRAIVVNISGSQNAGSAAQCRLRRIRHDRQGLAFDKTCRWAAKKKDGGRNFLFDAIS
jgi:hypothetical protein